jgi:hypothetical protein
VKAYGNKAGNSGVQAYETGADFILVKFAGRRKPYTYSTRSTSAANVEKMKELAQAGEGLSTFISQVVKDGYEHQ